MRTVTVVSNFDIAVTPSTYYDLSYYLTSVGGPDNYWASTLTTLLLTGLPVQRTVLEELSNIGAFDVTPRIFRVYIPPTASRAQLAFTARHVSALPTRD
jgi:hypothetical protein